MNREETVLKDVEHLEVIQEDGSYFLFIKFNDKGDESTVITISERHAQKLQYYKKEKAEA